MEVEAVEICPTGRREQIRQSRWPVRVLPTTAPVRTIAQAGKTPREWKAYMKDMADKVAIVTGGASGMGQIIAAAWRPGRPGGDL